MTLEGSGSTHLPRRENIELLDSRNLVAPRGHYSHVALHAGIAYISGQLPVDAAGVPLTDRPFAVQAHQVLTNLDHCLRTAGSSRERLLSVQVFITDMTQWPAFDAAYAHWVGAHRPSRAVASVHELHYGAALEVHAVAAIGQAPCAARPR